MADMCVWTGLPDVVDRKGGAYPTMLAPGTALGGTTMAAAETIATLTTSKQSSAIPAYAGRAVTLVFVRAVGGAIWITAGADPTAVAAAANAVYVASGEILPIGVTAGHKIAGINAA